MKIYLASPTAARSAAALALAALLGILGCDSSSKQKSSEGKPEAAKESIPDLRGATFCIGNTMLNPKEPFHLFLLRKDDDMAAPFTSEADFTPDTVEGTTNWSRGQETVKISSVHSDVNAWGEAVRLLAGPLPSDPWGMAQSAATAAGADPAGGYDTNKYVFDTAGLSETDKLRYERRFKAKNLSVTGTAWVTKDTRCMVKFVCDYKFTGEDGTVGSTHFEGSLTKR